MAATAGNVMYVKTLLSQYKVDLECECNVIFDGLVVYGATALWVAAGLGHLQIVKLLVRHGANVNHNTKAQSSPLRGKYLFYFIKNCQQLMGGRNWTDTSRLEFFLLKIILES